MCVLYHIALIIAHSLSGLDTCMDMDMDVDVIIRDENEAETK